jgi:hypothetical protein
MESILEGRNRMAGKNGRKKEINRVGMKDRKKQSGRKERMIK